MSSYTMPLRAYIEQFTQYQEGLTWSDKLEQGRPNLFDFDYPFFDPDYKKVFETNFIKFFYTREIGFETEELFKLKLDTWLNINMPYFNKMFESELLDFDPLSNTVTDTTYNKTNDRSQNDTRDSTQNSHTLGETTGSSENHANGNTTQDNFGREIEADTPDTRLALTTNDGEGILEYASNIEEQTQNNTTNSSANSNASSTDNTDVNTDATINDKLTSNINDVEDYIQHRAGKIGVQTYSKMVQEYRESFIRIEKQIFDEMQELFMGVY